MCRPTRKRRSASRVLEQFNTTSAPQKQRHQQTTFDRPSLSNSPISKRAEHAENEARRETTKCRRTFRTLLLAPRGARFTSTLSASGEQQQQHTPPPHTPRCRGTGTAQNAAKTKPGRVCTLPDRSPLYVLSSSC